LAIHQIVINMKNEVMSLISSLICFLDDQRDGLIKRRYLLDSPLLAAEDKLWDQIFFLRNGLFEKYLCS